MKKLMMIGLVVAMVGASSIAALSWGPGSGMGMGGYGGYGPGYHMGMGGYGGYGSGARWGDYDRRSLTEEQEAKLEALDRRLYDETRQLRRDLWTKRDKLDELMSSENPNRDEVMSLQKEISQLKEQMQEKHLDFALEAKKIVPDSSTSGSKYGPGMMRGGYGGGMMRGGYGPGMMGGGSGYCWR